MQDLDEFKRAVDSPRAGAQRRRLQELADQIPKGYGSGDTLDRALEECHRLRGELALARKRAKIEGEIYADHISLMNEERRILEDLGLTANLFRSDAQ